MQEVTFKGYLIIPNTDIKPLEVTPNAGSQDFEITTEEEDIVIHSIYVSHNNAVAVLLKIEPVIPVVDKDLTFEGYFSNETKDVPFHPPIGPYRKGRIRITATGTGATEAVIVNVQYSKVEG